MLTLVKWHLYYMAETSHVTCNINNISEPGLVKPDLNIERYKDT